MINDFITFTFGIVTLIITIGLFIKTQSIPKAEEKCKKISKTD